ncbi:MAG TPA: YetF domain-containing protein [Bryobacteraceae bacterium]|nr:YetF domain-containing protein [Bryobacteraceae bacterium]
MDTVFRGFAVYVFLLLVFRIAGKRTLAETTTFDLVLLLILSETIQQALVDTDSSMTSGFLLVLTLVSLNVLLSMLKVRYPSFERWVDGLPVIVVENGKALTDRMKRLRLDEDDVMEAARELQGLERLEQIKYAVVERSGQITIVPR